MKLYFYILKEPYNKEMYLHFEECEVVEKPKTYKPVNKFPSGIFRDIIMKNEIGGFLSGYSNIVVLDKKDYHVAKEIFCNKYNREIKEHLEAIDKLNKKKYAIEAGEDNYK